MYQLAVVLKPLIKTRPLQAAEQPRLGNVAMKISGWFYGLVSDYSNLERLLQHEVSKQE